MRYLLSIILGLCCSLSFGQGLTEKKYTKLVWSEEFNYTGLPDANKWGYEKGFVRNKENQYYTTKRKENAFVHDGYLEIKGVKDTYPNEKYKAGTTDWKTKDSLAQYTSASINTFGKASWTYGKIEVRARIPKALGVWPAIWMLGVNRGTVSWPMCGEIDIMEFVGHDSNHIHGTLHYAKADEKGHSSNTNKITVNQPFNDFHIYGLEWDENELKISFDGTVYQTFKVEAATIPQGNPFKKPFYLLLNLALGGSWGGKIEDTNLPASYLIDYVRVYQ